MESEKQREPIPAHFQSVAQAAEFWDRHDLSDYAELTHPIALEARLERRVFLTALEPELAEKLEAHARTRGVSTETLINVWLAEKLQEATPK